MKFRITNDFHTTEATIHIAGAGAVLEGARFRRVRRELCGLKSCGCGFARGIQPVNGGLWLVPETGDSYIIESRYGELCPVAKDGKHVPDQATLTVTHDSEHAFIDVNCSLCGRSGCVLRFDPTKVDW